MQTTVYVSTRYNIMIVFFQVLQFLYNSCCNLIFFLDQIFSGVGIYHNHWILSIFLQFGSLNENLLCN